MQIAAAYIRVSTEDQTEYSPDSQLKMIRNYAKSHDMTIPAEFIYQDEGISGKRAEKRPAFMKMIAAAKAHAFDVILVYSLSRFARSREDSVVYKRMLRHDLGIDVISISQQLSNDKTSILIEALLEAMDEYYSIDLGENVKRGMIEKISRGEPAGAAPYGYKVQDKTYIVDEEKAAVVRMIYEDFASGMGCRDIALKLNTMGIKTSRGNAWENRTVKYILNNPAYIGKLRWDPQGQPAYRKEYSSDTIIAKGSYEHIIDDNLYSRVSDRLLENKKSYAFYSREVTKNGYTLQGIVKCSACGSTMSRISTSENTSLQCNAYAKGKCRISHSIKASELERRILDIVEDDMLNARIIVHLPSPNTKTSHELDIVRQRIKREEAKLKRIKEAYEDGIDTLEEYKERKNRILNTIEELRRELAVKTPVLSKKAQLKLHKEILSQLRDENTAPYEKNRILKMIVKNVIYSRPDNKIIVFYH